MSALKHRRVASGVQLLAPRSCSCRPSSPGAPLLLSVVTQRTCSFPLSMSPLCGLLHYSFFFFLIYISVSRHSVISLFIKVQSYRVFINFILQSFALPQYTQASQYFSRGRLSSRYTVSCPSCDGRGSKMRGLNLAS